MLAKTPKTAAEHGISERELDALHWFRTQLATGALKGLTEDQLFDNRTAKGTYFNIGVSMLSEHRCGTVGCIGGWMATHMGMSEFSASDYVDRFLKPESPFYGLFWPMLRVYDSERYDTPEQAVAAIDRWLEGERDPNKLWPDPDEEA